MPGTNELDHQEPYGGGARTDIPLVGIAELLISHPAYLPVSTLFQVTSSNLTRELHVVHGATRVSQPQGSAAGWTVHGGLHERKATHGGRT